MNLRILYFAAQLFAAMILLTFREEKRRFCLPVLAVTAALSIIVSYGSAVFSVGTRIDFYLILILQAIGWNLAVKGSLQIVFFYYVAAMLLQNGTYCVYSIIQSLLGISDAQPLLHHLLHIAVFLVVYALFAVLVLRSFYRFRDCVILRKKTVAVTLLVFLINQICENHVSTVMESGASLFFYLYSALCAFLALSLQFGVLWNDIFRTESERIAEILEKEREQHRLSEDNRKLINAKCHDLKQQVAAIRQMNARSDQMKGLEELEDAVMFYDHFLKTGSDALDLVLSEKTQICGEYGIELVCVAEGEALAFMDEIDIYTLFGNILDNAIECLTGEDADRRRITLNVIQIKGLLSIHMENYCSQKTQFEDGLPKTTKGSTDYHGYGLKSVRYLAEKYGGSLTAAQEDEMFLINIVIPVKSCAGAA